MDNYRKDSQNQKKNVIFIYAEIVVEECGGKYYHNFLPIIIDRYSEYGNLTLVISKRKVNIPTQSLVNISDFETIFVERENTLKKKFITCKSQDKIIKQAIDKNEVVICHFPSSISDKSINYAKKTGKITIGVVLGCIWDTYTHYNLKGKLIAPLSYVQMRNAIRRCDGVIYVTRRFLEDRYRTNGKILACSDVQLGHLSETALRGRLRERIQKIDNFSNQNELNLLTIGAVNVKYKGHRYILKAIQKLRNERKVFYTIVGGGNDDSLKKYAKKLGVENQVRFVGNIPHDEIYKYLLDTDIYVQPSEIEGLPRTILEAMSYAVPIIASKTGGIPELLSQKYLFNVGAISEICQMLCSINEKKLKEMAIENIEKVIEYDETLLGKERDEFIKIIIGR